MAPMPIVRLRAEAAPEPPNPAVIKRKTRMMGRLRKGAGSQRPVEEIASRLQDWCWMFPCQVIRVRHACLFISHNALIRQWLLSRGTARCRWRRQGWKDE